MRTCAHNTHIMGRPAKACKARSSVWQRRLGFQCTTVVARGALTQYGCGRRCGAWTPGKPPCLSPVHEARTCMHRTCIHRTCMHQTCMQRSAKRQHPVHTSPCSHLSSSAAPLHAAHKMTTHRSLKSALADWRAYEVLRYHYGDLASHASQKPMRGSLKYHLSCSHLILFTPANSSMSPCKRPTD